MTISCTRIALFALMAVTLGTAGPALAQQPARKASPAKPSVTTRPASTAPRTAAAQPVASAQKPVATQTSTPAAPAHAAPAPKTSPSVAPRPAASAQLARQKYLNLGIGLAAYYGGGLPLGASFEVDMKNNISVGGSVDYLRYGYNSGGYKWNYTFVYAGARASYHLGELLSVDNDKFDPYVGATLGFRYAGYRDNYGYNDYVSPYNSGLFLGVHLGSRYMFSDKVGGFAEVGYGVSALRLGVTAKF